MSSEHQWFLGDPFAYGARACVTEKEHPSGLALSTLINLPDPSIQLLSLVDLACSSGTLPDYTVVPLGLP